MLSHARSDHVGDQSGHCGRAQHFVQSPEALVMQVCVDIEEEVIHVLHDQGEVLRSELVGKAEFLVELGRVRLLTNDRHEIRPRVFGGRARLGDEIVRRACVPQRCSSSSGSLWGRCQSQQRVTPHQWSSSCGRVGSNGGTSGDTAAAVGVGGGSAGGGVGGSVVGGLTGQCRCRNLCTIRLVGPKARTETILSSSTRRISHWAA